MHEAPGQRARARLRRAMLAIICALPLGGLAAPVWAGDLPAGLRACAEVPDSSRRLACYDSEMARLLGKAAHAARPAAAPTAAAPLISSAATSPPKAVASPPAAGSAPARRDAAAQHPSVWRFLSGGTDSQVTARITRLDRWPDAMVLHLDNGQVWRQIGRASGDLGLHPGDRVKIEKHLGSYWLSSRYVSGMQVRLETR